MSHYLNVLNTFLGSEVVDVDAVLLLLKDGNISSGIFDDGLIEQINSNPELLCNKEFISFFRGLVELKINEELDSSNKLIDTYFGGNTYSKCISCMPVEDDDTLRIEIPEEEQSNRIKYSLFLPEQNVSKTVTIKCTNKHYTFTGKSKIEPTFDESLVDVVFKIENWDPILINESQSVSYTYRVTLMSSGFCLPDDLGKQNNHTSVAKMMILRNILNVLGITYLSPTNSTHFSFISTDVKVRTAIGAEEVYRSKPGDSYILIRTLPKLTELAVAFNTRFSNIFSAQKENYTDFIGKCYFESNRVILVPETFKLFASHVSKITQNNVFQYEDTEDVNHITEDLRKSIVICNKQTGIPNFVTFSRSGTNVEVSFKQTNLKMDRNLFGSVSFDFAQGTEDECKDFVRQYVSPVCSTFSGDQRVVFRISSYRRDRGVICVELKYSVTSFFDGHEDVIFKVETQLSNFFRSKCYEPNQSLILLARYNNKPLTEKLEKYSFFNSRDQHIRPLSIIFNRSKVPLSCEIDGKEIDLQKYVFCLNSVLSKLFFIFAKKISMSESGERFRSLYTSCLPSEIMRTHFSKRVNSIDTQINCYMLRNFGFIPTEQEKDSSTDDAIVYETEMCNTYSNYDFVDVPTREIYVLKKSTGEDTVIFIGVDFRQENPPVISHDSDVPLKVLNVNSTSRIYLMSKFRPNLRFTLDEFSLINLRTNIPFGDTRVFGTAMKTIMYATIQPSRNPIVNNATILRFFLNSMNYNIDSVSIIEALFVSYSDLRTDSFMEVFRHASCNDILPEYIRIFMTTFLEEASVSGINPKTVATASEHLTDSNYWLFSYMLNLIESMKTPIGYSNFPTVDLFIQRNVSEILEKKKVAYNVSAHAGHVIDMNFVLERLHESNDVFLAYITSIQASLNNLMIQEDLNGIFSSILDQDAYLIKQVGSSYEIAIDSQFSEQFLTNAFVLGHSLQIVTFNKTKSATGLISRGRDLSPLFDAFFELRTKDQSDEELITKYIVDNVRYQDIDETRIPDLHLVTISEIRTEDDIRVVTFSLPFEDVTGKLCVSRPKVEISERSSVSLITKSCYLVLRNGAKEECCEISYTLPSGEKSELPMLNPHNAIKDEILSADNVDAYKTTCWSGLTSMRSMEFPCDILKEDAFSIFFLIHADSLNSKMMFTIESRNVFAKEVFLMPCNPYKLYAELLSSKMYSIEERHAPLQILSNLDLAKMSYDGYTAGNVLTAYKCSSTYTAPKDTLLIVSNESIDSVVYDEVNVARQFSVQMSKVPLAVTTDIEQLDVGPIEELRYQHFDAQSDTSRLEQLEYHKTCNMSMSTILPQTIMSIGDIRYSNGKMFNFHSFSDNKKVLALVSDVTVQLFILVGNCYRHISTINTPRVNKVSFGGSMFVITSTDSIPEDNKIWLIATGGILNISLPGYVNRVGDVVNGVVKNEAGKPEKKINVEITSVVQNPEIPGVKPSYKFYSGKSQIVNITNSPRYNLFFFSKTNMFMVYNDNGVMRVMDMNTFQNLEINSVNGVVQSSCVLPLVSQGTWKYENGEELFHGMTPSGDSICISPLNLSASVEVFKFDLPVSVMPNNVYVSKLGRDNDVNTLFATASINAGGIWLYNTYVKYANSMITFYRISKRSKYIVSYPVVAGSSFAFDQSTITVSNLENVYDELIKNMKLDVAKFGLIGTIRLSDVTVLFEKTEDDFQLPLIQTSSGNIYVTLFRQDQIICTCYTSYGTIITHYGPPGRIEYTIVHECGIVCINGKPSIYNEKLEMVDLVRPKRVFQDDINDEFKVTNVIRKTVFDKAIVTNSIMQYQYSKTENSLRKSIDDYPISSCLIPYRHDDYELVELTSSPSDKFLVPYPQIVHGNLILYIVGNELRVIPRIVQKKQRSKDDIIRSVQEEYLESDREAFISKYEQIKAFVDKISATYPELSIFKQTETAIYKLVTANGNLYKGTKYSELENYIKLQLYGSTLTMDDYRINLILDKKYFRAMHCFFSGHDINSLLVRMYTDEDELESKIKDYNDRFNEHELKKNALAIAKGIPKKLKQEQDELSQFIDDKQVEYDSISSNRESLVTRKFELDSAIAEHKAKKGKKPSTKAMETERSTVIQDIERIENLARQLDQMKVRLSKYPENIKNANETIATLTAETEAARKRIPKNPADTPLENASEMYDVIRIIAPEIYPIRRETHRIFRLSEQIANSTADMEVTDGGNYNAERIAMMLRILTSTQSDEHSAILDLFELRSFFARSETDFGKFNIANMGGFDSYRSGSYNLLLSMLNSFETIMGKSIIIDKTKEELRSSVHKDMIRYYALSKEFIRGSRVSNNMGLDVAMCNYSLSSHVPLLYRATDEFIHEELSDLRELLNTKISLFITGSIKCKLFFNIAFLEKFLQEVVKTDELRDHLESVKEELLEATESGDYDDRFILLDDDADISETLLREVHVELSKEEMKLAQDLLNKISEEDYEVPERKSHILINLGNLIEAETNAAETIISKIIEMRKEKLQSAEAIISSQKDLSDRKKEVEIFKNNRNSSMVYRCSELSKIYEDLRDRFNINFDGSSEITIHPNYQGKLGEVSALIKRICDNDKETTKYDITLIARTEDDDESGILSGSDLEKYEALLQLRVDLEEISGEVNELIVENTLVGEPYITIRDLLPKVSDFEYRIRNFLKKKPADGKKKKKGDADIESALKSEFVEFGQQVNDVVELLPETHSKIMEELAEACGKDFDELSEESLQNLDDLILQFSKYIIQIEGQQYLNEAYADILVAIEKINAECRKCHEVAINLNEMKKSEANIKLLSDFVEIGTMTTNDIVLQICETCENSVDMIERLRVLFSTNCASEGTSMFITGMNTEINAEYNKKTEEEIAEEKAKKRELTKREKAGRLQSRKGDDERGYKEATDNYEEAVETDKLPVYNIPLHIICPDLDGNILSYHRNAYRVMKASYGFYELLENIKKTNYSKYTGGIFDRIICYIAEIIKELSSEKYVRDIIDPISAYDNLIKQELYLDVLLLLKDIQKQRILNVSNSFDGQDVDVSIIVRFLTEIGNIVFSDNLFELNKQDSEESNDILLMLAEKYDGEDVADCFNWILSFIHSSVFKSGSLSNFEAQMLGIFNSDIASVISRSRDDPALVERLKRGMYVMNNFDKFSIITREDLAMVEEAIQYSETFAIFINTKTILCEHFKIEGNIYTTPLTFIISNITDDYVTNIDALQWYRVYGESPLVGRNIPVNYFDYHVPSIQEKVRNNLKKLRSRQYRTQEPTEEQLEFRSVIAGMVEDYSKGSGSDDLKSINEIIIRFDDLIQFAPTYRRSDDELTPIEIEFITKTGERSPIDMYDNKVFSVSLFDVLQNCITGSKPRFDIKVSDMLKSKSISLADLNPDSQIVRLFGKTLSHKSFVDEKRLRLLTTCLFGLITVKSRWSMNENIIGINIGQDTYNMTVSSLRDINSVPRVIGNGNDDFGFHGLEVLSPVRSVKNDMGYTEIFTNNRGKEIMRYFTVKRLGKNVAVKKTEDIALNFKGRKMVRETIIEAKSETVTAIEFQSIVTGEKRIFLLDTVYTEIKFVKDQFMCTNKSTLQKFTRDSLMFDAVERLQMNQVSFGKTTHSNFKQSVSLDGYVAVLSNYVTNNNTEYVTESYGSCIRLIRNSKESSVICATLVFPELMIYDFNYVPPYKSDGALFTIAGTTTEHNGTRVRLGTVNLPNNPGLSYVVNSFSSEARLPQTIYSSVESIQLHGMINNCLFISGRTADGQVSEVINIWNTGSITTINLTTDFPTSVNAVYISKSERFIAVVIGNTTVVYNTIGQIINTFTGEGLFI